MDSIEKLYSLYLDSKGICTDSRKIKENQIFFALSGENFDGNQYAKIAFEKGAKLAVIDTPLLNIEDENSLFLVENTLETLQKLAQYHRNKLTIPVIGLTGSNGKTTTKELISIILRQKYNVCYTQGNLNNHIGVPISLLSINKTHDIAVIEMGANHQKEIEFLSSICKPDIGYITNFGKAHIEGFGGIEGVIKGKTELYNFLERNNKKAIINIDDPIQVKKSVEIKNKITFSFINSKADYLFFSQKGNENFLKIKTEGLSIQTRLIGDYNFSNIAVAIALGKYFEVPESKIKKALETYNAENNRSEYIVKENGQKVIMDAYNANPSSMKVAIDNLSKIEGSKLAILGDMFELGQDSIQEHEMVLETLIEKRIDQAYLVGLIFSELSDKFKNSNFTFFKKTEECLLHIEKNSINVKNILVKGSRGMKLEKLKSIVCL